MNSHDINAAIRNATGIQRDNFDSNLNVMRDAEDSLNHREKIEFAGRLTEMFYGPTWTFDVVHASASQRAETFLRTKGLWREAAVEKGTE